MPLLLSGLLLACAGEPRATTPARSTEVQQAKAAYQAYCGACPDAEGCCLGAADFNEQRFSARAGRYLRAMRDYYECQRTGALKDEALYTEPAPPPFDGFGR